MVVRRLYIIVMVALAVLIHWGCTELGEGIKVHPDRWADPGGGIHGDKVALAGLESCTQCHGQEFDGGTAGVTCSNTTCHIGGKTIPHPARAEFIDPTHENYHGRIFWLNNWDFSYCQTCHGQNLDGGVVDFDCSNTACHTATGGVFACNNCHAALESESFIDVQNNTDQSVITVGAHTSHYTNPDSLTANVDCASCHVVPDSVWAAGHIDASPYAEVTFDSLSTANGTLSPVWDRSAGTCSQVYCHGTFTFGDVTGNDTTWTWTDTFSGENLCATCHSYPPIGHLSLVTCGSCHKSVVGADHLSIIDTQKHINGQVDYP